MASPDRTRRRTLLWLGAGLSLLAGCGETDRTTPDPEPPPNGTGATPTEPLGPGPEGGEHTPAGTEPIQRGTGTAAPRDVVFSKPGGGEVAATLYGEGDCGVVLVPQIDMDRQSWDRYARRLADAGYRAIAIDEGESRKAAGVAAAVDYLRNEVGVESVVVIGASSGGAAAVRAAADDPDAVDGLVTLSAAGGADVADQLEPPAMFVVATGDAEEYVTTAETLAAAVPGEGDLVTYEGDAHGQALLESPHADAIRSRIGVFLEEVCGSDDE